MAITLQQLCEKASYLYGMRLLAGEEGMKNIVQWTHTIESMESSEFLHGGELVCTTGIAYKDNTWLLPFVKKLKEKKCSGLILNFGPHLSNAPPEVVKYCSQVGFPLFEVPWKTHLVDMTRDFCNQIIASEKEEVSIGSAFEKVIFSSDKQEESIAFLELHDFRKTSSYTILAVHAYMNREVTRYLNQIKKEIENIIYSKKRKTGYFIHNGTFFFILCDFTGREIEDVVSQVQMLQFTCIWLEKVYVAVGPEHKSIYQLPNLYQKTVTVLNLGEKKKKSPLYYDKFGINKIFLSVDEPSVLQEYYNEVLGRLERFDKENETDYMEFLKKYLENECSVQKMAEESYVHRNTIHNRVRKIKKILGYDIGLTKNRLKIMLAFEIKDILI